MQELPQTECDLIYLLQCAVNNMPADAECTAAMDLPAILHLAKEHMVSALTAAPLLELWRSNPAPEELVDPWRNADLFALRRYVMFSAEEDAICAWLSERGIWHMPLKGSVLRHCYRQPHLRESCDIDILFDESRRQEVWSFMEGRGYTGDTSGKCDCYQKDPIFNVEMHRGLIDNDNERFRFEYYQNIRERLVASPEDPYALRFTDEDYYVYHVVHAARHDFHGGAGIRSLVDFCILNREKGASLDRDAIARELDTLKLSDYERRSRQLAQKIFDPGKGFDALSPEELDFLARTMSGGAYGILDNWIEQGLGAERGKGHGAIGAKVAYTTHRAFPSYESMSRYNENLKKHPWLLPYYWFKRIARGIAKPEKRSELGKIVRH